LKYALISISAATALSVPLILESESSLLYVIFTFLVVLLLQVFTFKFVSIFLKAFIGLFILGNWLKVTIHGIFNHPYVEATGQFSGTRAQWDSFFSFSIVISLGLIAAVILNIAAPRVNGSNNSTALEKTKNETFTKFSVAIIIIVYALNWQFGFFRIGVGSKVDLPLGLNAPAAFMVFLGAPMLVAILASNSVAKMGRVTPKALIGVAIISLVSAIVTYSRASVAILMLPIALGMYRKSKEINGRSESISKLLIVMSITTVVALVSVSIARIYVFGGAATVARQFLVIYLYESLGLFLDRWLGAESLMVAVSSNQSLALFLDILREDPASGVQSIYQILSGSQYLDFMIDYATFLTLPGIFALLAFSGSYIVVFFGVLATSLFGIFVNQVVIKAFPRQYSLQYLISGSVAYHFSQMVFPLLFIPYVVQLVFFLVVLKFYYSGSMRKPKIGSRFGYN